MPKYGKRFKKILDERRKHPSYWADGIRLDFISELEEEMERQGVSQAELSRRLKKSPAYISKVFNADVGNFTLETLAEFSMALDMKVNIGIEPISMTIPDWDEHIVMPEVRIGVTYNSDLSDLPAVESVICGDFNRTKQEETYGRCSSEGFNCAA